MPSLRTNQKASVPSTREEIAQLTYATVVARNARERGDDTYILFEEQRYSFRDAHLLSNRIANGLLAAGIRKGERVALLLDNCPELVWLYLGLGKIGAVAVPLNTAAKGMLLEHQLRHAQVTAIVAQSSCLDGLAALDAAAARTHLYIMVGHDEAAACRARQTFSSVLDYDKLASGADHDPVACVRFTDVAYLSYTSGTSGPSKPNISTQCHPFTMAWSIASNLGYTPQDVMYTCLPLFHGNAMRSLFVAQVTGCSVAIARRFSASQFWSDIKRYGATQFNLLGVMATILWNAPPSELDSTHGARLCLIVSMPDFAADFAKRFNVKLAATYALTDFGYVSFLKPDDPLDKLASAGRPCDDMEVVITDEDDFPLPQGAPGEICVRPRTPWSTAQGYEGMDAATVAAWRNFWFHTGDRGYFDADGYLYFVDRKKDVIRRRGENISSYEIEHILCRHPDIAQAAAYPVRSELSEDEIMVSLVLRVGTSLGCVDVIRYCEAQMAGFMVPRYIEFLDALPLTPTEKVEKYKLKARAEQHLDQVWDREVRCSGRARERDTSQ